MTPKIILPEFAAFKQQHAPAIREGDFHSAIEAMGHQTHAVAIYAVQSLHLTQLILQGADFSQSHGQLLVLRQDMQTCITQAQETVQHFTEWAQRQ